MTADDRERVVEVVRDAAGETAHRLHALGTTELLLQLAFELPDAAEREPREYPFGYFSRDAFPLSGVGVFRWFATEKDALLGYAAELIEHLYEGAEEDDREALRALFGSALKEHKTLRDIRGELNELTRDNSVLEWYGSFHEFCTSDDEFAKDLRECFLEEFDEDSESGMTSGKIPEDRTDEFVEFIQGYGY
jgi:hypothetical protein